MGQKLSKRKRYAACRGIQNQATLLAHVEHELWRAGNVEKGGLMEGEREYLEKRAEMLKKVREDLGKLGSRLQGTL